MKTYIKVESELLLNFGIFYLFGKGDELDSTEGDGLGPGLNPLCDLSVVLESSSM